MTSHALFKILGSSRRWLGKPRIRFKPAALTPVLWVQIHHIARSQIKSGFLVPAGLFRLSTKSGGDSWNIQQSCVYWSIHGCDHNSDDENRLASAERKSTFSRPLHYWIARQTPSSSLENLACFRTPRPLYKYFTKQNNMSKAKKFISLFMSWSTDVE